MKIFYQIKIYFIKWKYFGMEWKYILLNENISVSNFATFRQVALEPRNAEIFVLHLNFHVLLFKWNLCLICV